MSAPTQVTYTAWQRVKTLHFDNGGMAQYAETMRPVALPKFTYPANTEQQIRNAAIHDCALAVRAAGVEVET